jgi:hypothetical protein
MVDHSQANDPLKKLAEGDDIFVPQQLDAEHRQVHDGLRVLAGPEFDVEYLRVQVQDHQRMIQLTEYEIGSGADPEVQYYAAVILPKMFIHLAAARDLLDHYRHKTRRSHPRRRGTSAGCPRRKHRGRHRIEDYGRTSLEPDHAARA